MWLNLDIDGIDLHLRVNDYTPSKPTDNDDNWCRLDLTLQSQKWLNYEITNNPILMSCEVEALINSLDLLLNNNDIAPAFNIEFIEPDLTFTLYPKQDVRSNPSVIYVSEGNEIVDIDLEMQVHFWNDGLSANYLTLNFNRIEIQHLVTYLKFVTNELTKDDNDILLLLDQGIFSSEY